MEMLTTDIVILHFTQVGPSYKRNQQRRQFAKSARHHAGLESRLQNPAANTETPPQHPAEEPAKHSGPSLPRRRLRRQLCAPSTNCRRL